MISTLTAFKNYQKVVSLWLEKAENISPINIPEKEVWADLSKKKAAFDARSRELRRRMDESLAKAKALLHQS